jgi:hypothetical protein
VVWISYKGASCARCGADLGRGELIVMDRSQGIRCIGCAGLGGLVFLPSGDVALTQRALAHSSRSAIVVIRRDHGDHQDVTTGTAGQARQVPRPGRSVTASSRPVRS